MDIAGLIFELIFLAIGIYLYLFSRGIVMPKDKATNASAEKFRQANAKWMRPLSIVLVAVMTIEIIVHLRDLFN